MDFGTAIALAEDVLRITPVEDCDTVTLKLEGRLVGLWADEVRVVVLQAELWRERFIVDVCDVTFADRNGEQVLLWLHRLGAQFVGDASFPRFLCRRLRIPLSAINSSHGKGSPLRS